MPSFAKLAAVDASNPLIGLWKDQSGPSPLKDLLTDRRTRAAQILSADMPSKLTHIRALIAAESDPSSALWVGHLESGDFTLPRMMQPDHLYRLLAPGPLGPADGESGLKGEDLEPGEKVVLPSQITRADGGLELEQGLDDDGDEHLAGVARLSMGKANGNGHLNGAGSGKVTGNGCVEGTMPVEKGVRVGPHWFEVVPRNKVQTDLAKLVVKEHEDLHAMVQDLRVWLELEIPLIEDGNSFGAEVQNHLIKELLTAYQKSNSYINASRQHHTDRIKLITDWVKYPNVMDYPAAITSSDRFDNFISRSYLRSLLMIYGGLLTRFQRNWEKVINPKGTGGGSSGGVY